LHGLHSHGFPNCFFLGFTQTAVTVNVPHALNEQARHVAYVVSEARARGSNVVEASAKAERAYVEEVHSLARLGERFYAECTPGYYNSEGAPGNRHGFFSDMYGAGPLRFFKLLREWREDGRLEGLDLR
jgi:cyclohexanone monooxygenase